jgi:CPA1 family monovalent cation:H+ antiporter
LVTLVFGGLTLPLIVKALAVPEDASEEEDEVRDGLRGMTEAALQELNAIEAEGKLDKEAIARLRLRFEHRRQDVEGQSAGEDTIVDAEQRLLAAQLQALLEMRERGSIDNTVLRRLQHVLDISQERLDRGVH